MEDTNNNNSNSKKDIQIDTVSSIEKNELNSFQNDSQNQNGNSGEEEQKQTFEDEEGNLLDPNDLSYNSEDDQNSVIIFDSELHFSQKIDQVDIVFLIDTTRSMNPYLKGIKRYIRKLIFEARKSVSHYLNDDVDVLKLALVAYRDHDQEDYEDSYVSKTLCDLNEDYNVFRKALYEISCYGGDDECEAVVDGLHEAVNLVSWREDSIKLIYHFCGSPCHGSAYRGENAKSFKKYDKYEKGCPCGVDIKTTLKSLRGKYIEYSMIALGEGLERMTEEFSKFIKVELMASNIERQEGIDDDQLKSEEEKK